MSHVGIQGLEASYSDAALTLAEPTARKTFYERFSDVFDSLNAGRIDKAFLPFENSTAGFIAENYRLLDHSGVFATGEFIHRIEHCLLAPKGARIEDIEGVYSHPQALAQCTHTLHALNLKAEPWFDTAGAARDVARSQNKAALASSDASRVYGLEILKKGMNDEPENFTRFLILERERNWGKRILLSCDVAELRALVSSDAKLIAMLTHPEPKIKWGHRVYLELERQEDTDWSQWIKNFSGLRVLGSFDGKR